MSPNKTRDPDHRPHDETARRPPGPGKSGPQETAPAGTVAAGDERSTADLLALADAHMTHNYAPAPLIVARGAGTRLWDTDGKEYLDFAGGVGVNALGHAHPRVLAAIAQQAQRFSHTGNGYYHSTYIDMCARLASLCFGDRIFLCNSGTEAAEAALKVARLFFHHRGEDRTQWVATEGSFHGRSMGALSVTGQPACREGFGPLIPGVRFAPFGDLDAMASCIGPHTAAVIVEPIQGNSGVVVPPAHYLKGLRQLCDREGSLLIFDEIQTGIGRTGRWFAYEHDGVTPDLMTLAKGLGGGLPLGALVMKHAVAACLRPGAHGSTFGGNPVACAAGLATIREIEEHGLLDHAERAGFLLRELLTDVAARRGRVREVRGRGLLLGLALHGPAKAVITQCRNKGLLCTGAGGNVLRFFPPLNVGEADLEQAARIVDSALASTSCPP